jgi:hypothetical protein
VDLSKLANRPQLIKIVLDDEDTIAEYNEPIEFHTWDRQPLTTFMKISQGITADRPETIELLKTLILDSAGQPVMADEREIPIRLMIRAVSKIMDSLGK